MRITTLATLLAILATLAAGCGAALGNVSQPGTARLELRLIAQNEADGFKVPTWDGKMSFVVEKRVALSDRDVEKVTRSKLPDGSPSIDLVFDQTASLTLEDITSKHIGRRMAILVEGKVVIAPTIKEKIVGGHMTLAGFDAAQTDTIYTKIKKN